MKALVINLKKSTDRRERMSRILEQCTSLDIAYIDAVDGRTLTSEEMNQQFDVKKATFRSLRKLTPAEIGCTLSHQKCYHKIASENIPCALILEDDLAPEIDFESVLPKLQPLLDTPEPRVILLSGKFWWLTSRPLTEQLRIASVFDGYLTHAYLINLAGAQLLCEDRAGYLVDDWRHLIRKGLRLYGLLPHIVDQDRATFASTINAGKRQSLDSLGERIWSRIWREPFKYFRKQLLGRIGHFEPRDKPKKTSI